VEERVDVLTLRGWGISVLVEDSNAVTNGAIAQVLDAYTSLNISRVG